MSAPRVRVLIQRVTRASVKVDGTVVGRIGAGLLVLVGVAKGDGEAEVAAAARKLVGLRLFADEAGKMNRDVLAAGGSVLLVSQFTLVGSVDKGRRPSFDGAAPPDVARALVDRLGAEIRSLGVPVETGVFGAHMEVELVNDGPVTFVIDVAPGGQGAFPDDGVRAQPRGQEHDAGDRSPPCS